MNKPSPDSLESQLQKIQQQAKIAEQLLFSKNAEVQAAQRKLDTLREKFAKETAQLLENQNLSIASAENKLKKINQSVLDAEKSFLKQRNDQEHYYSKVEIEIADMTATLKVMNDRNISLQAENKVIGYTIETKKNEISDLITQKSQRELAISKLKTEETTQISVLADLDRTIYVAKQKLVSLDGEYDTKFSEKEAQQVLLDAKLLISRQELEKNQQEDAIIRDSFANWQKTLEERDTNLRIRERKVEQGESKLIQNSELLNL